ncbi:MAG: hydroxyacid dehydrogenase [Rhodospirillaceae bacterium]|nr:hydroxyacid dehydrogenase [Rhodospirillaceae bacterium]MBT7769517.1 hydroxyacid dehydrogenase [Rhodospirillales bacterium]MBT4703183.1 hydroxyacid dehydrogenase [Rhodospirillaceae bacterium]MBT5034896.1 hydroxyacid dehydrogenase [Rhodospirillaceae bacterium]MBT6221665.1 hydroxyacid dehydrogenase [Rhodospirillaceae bacterium]
MKKVLVLGKIVDAGLEILRAASDVEYIELPQHAPDLMEHVPDADAIIVRMTAITEDVVAAAPNLKIVARHGVGYERIDVPALTAKGIPLALVGNVNALAVAEHTLAMMLTVAKKFLPYDKATRTGNFGISDSFSATELSGKTILLAGFGRIGQEVAQRCKAFGMDVLIADPFVQAADVEAAGYRFTGDFKAALPEVDWVSIHIPKTPETENFIAAPEMAAMKEGAYLVNVSRGGMVDEAALYEALKSGHLRGAALDVFEPEPPGVDNPLFELDNFLASPHCGAFTEECAQRMSSACAHNVLAAFAGNLDPAVVVNKEVLEN